MRIQGIQNEKKLSIFNLTKFSYSECMWKANTQNKSRQLSKKKFEGDPFKLIFSRKN
jgi:hypothetical protein